MGWELVKPWVNRVGIVLEFLSFWFAAPEILGEERLRKLERTIERGIKVLPVTGLMAVMTEVIGGAMAAAVVLLVAARSWKVAVAVVALVVGAAVVVVAWKVAVAVESMLEHIVVRPLLRVLADDKRIRQRSLAVGAVLFVVGFLLQLIATF